MHRGRVLKGAFSSAREPMKQSRGWLAVEGYGTRSAGVLGVLGRRAGMFAVGAFWGTTDGLPNQQPSRWISTLDPLRTYRAAPERSMRKRREYRRTRAVLGCTGREYLGIINCHDRASALVGRRSEYSRRLPLALCLAAVDRLQRGPLEGDGASLRRYGGWRLHCLCEEVRRRAYDVVGRSLPTRNGIFPGTVHQIPRRHASVGLGGIRAAVADTLVVWRTAQGERKASTRQNEKRRRPARGREVFPTERRYQCCARTSPLRRGECSLPVGGTGARTVLACTENGRCSRREYNAGEAEVQPLHHPSTYSGFSSSADGSAEELRVVVSRRR